jgi:hypothetical protein
MFPNKTPLSDNYFNIIIIQPKSSTYNFFGIFQWHASSSIQEHNIFINISDTIIRIRNNSITIMTQHKEVWKHVLQNKNTHFIKKIKKLSHSSTQTLIAIILTSITSMKIYLEQNDSSCYDFTITLLITSIN